MRIIAVVPILNNIHVQSYNFKKYIPIGSPKISLEFLSNWGADEIILTNIKGSFNKQNIFYKNIKNYSENCFVPLTAGGGIRSPKDVENFLKSGADKVLINTYGLINNKLIYKCAKEFGKQAIVGCLDVKKSGNLYDVYVFSGQKKLKLSMLEACKFLQDNGVGEIFINSIDNDGSKKGFDENILKKVNHLIDVPLTICGGAANYSHFLKLKKFNLSGMAASNMFSFKEHSVFQIKKKVYKKISGIRPIEFK